MVYIGDGDSLCVAEGPTQGDWVEVRISDFYAPELVATGGREAKAVLERIAMGQRVECVAQRRSYDRVVAVCTVQGVSLGDRMRSAGVTAGRGSRPTGCAAAKSNPSGSRLGRVALTQHPARTGVPLRSWGGWNGEDNQGQIGRFASRDGLKALIAATIFLS